MKQLFLLTAAACAVYASPAAAAVVFTFDRANSFVDVTSNSTACIGSCRISATLLDLPSFSLDVGESFTFDFARFRIGNGLGFGSADIAAQLAFTMPGAIATALGDASYARAPGAFAGSLDWTGPQQITATDGTRFTVDFGDRSGANFGSTVRAPVTITLNGLAGAIPEPATWALMILGIGAVGGALRVRRQRTRVTYRID